MLVRDVMSTNVVAITSTTRLADARKIMEAHRIRRLRVVDKGKLVGIVTRDALDRVGHSKLTTLTAQQLTCPFGQVDPQRGYDHWSGFNLP
jgi:acetoin utilization protein AcuB